MNLVIFEGCDGCGKSYISSRLCYVLRDEGWKPDYMHWGPELDYNAEMYTDLVVNTLDECKDDGSRLLVWDRSWISEPIYAQVMARDNRLGPAERARIYEAVARNVSHLVVVYVYTQLHAEVDVNKERNDFTLPQLTTIHVEYDALFMLGNKRTRELAGVPRSAEVIKINNKLPHTPRKLACSVNRIARAALRGL